MKLSIKYFPHIKDNKWMLIREHGTYDQHAHFSSEKEARQCRKLIDSRSYPRNKKYKIAIKRILTKEEFSKLNIRSKYDRRYINRKI